jgi:GDP-L-fucose synthase
MINKNSKIFITGHKGLVGSSILKLLKNKGYKNLITIDKKKINLLDTKKVSNFIKVKKIDVIINCAARVGGILANSTYPVEFLYENIQMQNNLLFASKKFKIKRFIFLGSSCIYPKNSKTPIIEDNLLTGRLEKTNEAYAIGKITGIKLSEYLFYQNKLDIVCLMPTNVYGLNDNYDRFSSHVIPGMIMKFLDAKKKKNRKVELLGTGKPMREFLYSNDLAEAIFLIIKSKKNKILKVTKGDFPILNVGTGENISIKKLAEMIRKQINFKGKIFFNKNFPDGTMKKNLNSSRIKKLGWKPKVNLKLGIEKVVKYKLNYN